MKKFELTTDSIKGNGTILYRIKSLIDFGDVKAGDLGGYVEKEENLSQYGNAWVYDDAWVHGDAWVCDDTCVCDDALVCDNARVYGNTLVSGSACVCGNARVCGNAWVYGNAQVYGNALVYGNAQLHENACVCDDVRVYDNACIYGNAWVYGNACVCNDALVFSNADYICLKSFGSHNRSTTMFRGENENIYVSCGCFSGTLEEFENKVKETHGNNKFAREYLALIEATKIHFEV